VCLLVLLELGSPLSVAAVTVSLEVGHSGFGIFLFVLIGCVRYVKTNKVLRAALILI
jgi:hypothetical protein